MNNVWGKPVYMLIVLVLLELSIQAGAELTLSTGARYNWVRDDLPQRTKGTEIIVPISVRYAYGDQFSMSVDTGYAGAQVAYPENEESELAHLTDMLVNLNYAVPKLPIALSVGLNVNVPIGKERVTEDEQSATIGESNDLFGMEKFGEGLNVGVSLSAMKNFGTFGLGLNGLYVYKGEYDPTADIEDDTIDPGDQYLLAGLLIWQPSDTANIVGLLTYSAFGADRVDGTEDFQEGATLTAAGNLSYRYKLYDLAFSQQIVLPQKDRERIDESLQKEPENSGGITAITSLGVTYPFSLTFKGTLLGDVKYYGESDRKDPDNGLVYAGRRVRYSIGTQLTYAITPQFSCMALARYLRMHERQDLYLEHERRFEGVHATAEFTYVF